MYADLLSWQFTRLTTSQPADAILRLAGLDDGYQPGVGEGELPRLGELMTGVAGGVVDAAEVAAVR